MPLAFQIMSSLHSTVKMVNLNIYKISRTFHVSIVNYKRNMHLFPQFLIILFTETNQHHAFHVPHRSKLRDFTPFSSYFEHKEFICLLHLFCQRIHRCRNKLVFQRMPLIFLMVIDNHSYNFRIILCQKYPCHIRNILTLFQKFLNTPDCFVRYFLCFSVNHIRYSSGA